MNLESFQRANNHPVLHMIKAYWLIGGIIFAFMEFYLASIFVSEEYYWMRSRDQVSNALFFAGTFHFLISILLSRPARKLYNVIPGKKEKRDPFAGLDRFELSDHGYGINRKRTLEYRRQAYSFVIPGVIMFILSFVIV